MNKKKFDYLEDSLADLNEATSLSIETKALELEENIRNSNKEAVAPIARLGTARKKEVVELENYPPHVRKLLKRIENEDFAPLEMSMRFDKETMHKLKSICVELNVSSYKVVTLLIRDFIEKYNSK